MGVNKVNFGGKTLIDLTGDTLESADQLLKGIIAHAKDGSVITGLMEAGGGGTGYNFDGDPRWVSSGEFIVAETVLASDIDPILFNPKIMSGNDTDWIRGRYFLLFDATKTPSAYNAYTTTIDDSLNNIIAIINYAFGYGSKLPNQEFTAYLYAGGTYLLVEREYGNSAYDQISFANTNRKFYSGHKYCWVAWGMKAGNE